MRSDGEKRCASRLDGFAVFDARSARSIFPDVHAVGKNKLDFSAPVRAVEVGGFAANFAQAEFISAEHFN